MATTTDRERIRLSLDVSPELYALLESLAERTDESKSDVLRKAIVLMDVAVTASQEGKRLLVQEPPHQDGHVTQTKIIGLFPPGRNPAVYSRSSSEQPASRQPAVAVREMPREISGQRMTDDRVEASERMDAREQRETVEQREPHERMEVRERTTVREQVNTVPRTRQGNDRTGQ